MKQLLKALLILIIVIVIIAGVGFAALWFASADYRATPAGYDTPLALLRTAKVVSREKLEHTQNAAMLQFWNTVYTLADAHSATYLDTMDTTKQEAKIRYKTDIITIEYHMPSLHSGAVKTIIMTGEHPGIAFYFADQMIGRYDVTDSSGWNMQVQEGLYNKEEVSRLSGVVVSYSQALDNPFEKYALEEFADIAYVYTKLSVQSRIHTIDSLEQSLVYLQSISGDTLLFDPVMLFTGDAANAAFAKYDAAACTASVSGSAQTPCLAPNGWFVYNETQTGDTLKLVSTQDTMIIPTQTGSAGISDLQAYDAAVSGNVVYTIYFWEDILMEVREHPLP